MNNFTGIVIFIAGAVVGAAATWKYTKTKYQQIAQEEIDSVKETFNKKEAKAKAVVNTVTIVSSAKEKADLARDKADIVKFANKAMKHMNYNTMSKDNAEEPEQEVNVMPMNKEPYVISPTDFGNQDDYEVISLTYYADKLLADDADELVENIDDVVGFDSLNHFGDYEEDTVCVRNDRLKCDYEICKDNRDYMDIIKEG